MKKALSLAVAVIMAAMLLAGCSSGGSSSAVSSVAPSVADSSVASSASQSEVERQVVPVAGLKGPTTMGMVKLMSDAGAGLTDNDYQVTMYGTPDEIVPKLISGEVPIAAIPANLASVIYNNTSGKIKVAAINTLGVLYVVETGEAIQTVEDLRGKTIYSTGKGTTPEFALNYILTQSGIDPAKDVTIEFKSEATEIAALLKESSDAIAVLPQPYVTAVQMQNDKVRVALNLSEEWDKVSETSGMVTGVLVVNAAWLAENEQLFTGFLAAYEESILWVNANTAEAAQLVAQYGIVEKAPIAEKALPASNLVFIAGPEMKAKLSGYLQVLYDQKPESVGGQMPSDEFYYA